MTLNVLVCRGIKYARSLKKFVACFHYQVVSVLLLSLNTTECDECFSKVSLQQPRKQPTKRLTGTATTSGRRCTRQELCDAISYDYSYSLPQRTVHSSYISTVPTTDSILMP